MSLARTVCDTDLSRGALEDVRQFYLGLANAKDPRVWQGMVHVFPANLALLRAAVEALDVSGESLRAHVGPVSNVPSLPIPRSLAW
jgi:hypothetical protein